MYREFGVTKIYTNLAERKVIVEFTLDLDPDTVSQKTLVMVEKATGDITNFRLNTNRHIVEIQLLDWPKVDTEYMLRIQSGIQSIVEDNLPDTLQRSIVFKSDVTSAIEIVSPSHQEEIEKLFLSWKEIEADKDDGGLVCSYYLEIAKENAFYNIVKKTKVEGKQEVLLSDVTPGQYFVRIRAQRGDHYGKWSEVSTFIVTEPVEVIEEPVFEEELTISYSPANGETPSSFIIEFDEQLDDNSEYEVVLTRRSY